MKENKLSKATPSQVNVMQTQDPQIYFCNSPSGLAVIERKDLRKEKREAIRKLHQLDVRMNTRVLFFLGMWAVAAYGVMNVNMAVLQPLCYFGMGWAIMGCGIFMHEDSHGLLFKNPSLNRWIGFLCGLPTLIPFSAYRTNHLLHHAHERTGKDPDDIEVVAAKNSIPLVLMHYFALLLGAYVFTLHVALVAFKEANGKRKISIVTEYALIAASVAFLFWFFPTQSVLKIWVYPLLIASHLTSIRALPEHALTTGGNPFTATRTILSNKVMCFMLCNVNYHIEHHLFPGIPWYNLPKAHHLLADEYRRAGSSVYRSYTEFMIDFWKTSWTGMIANVRLIPKTVRKDVCA